jgi:hypothetical protein
VELEPAPGEVAVHDSVGIGDVGLRGDGAAVREPVVVCRKLAEDRGRAGRGELGRDGRGLGELRAQDAGSAGRKQAGQAGRPLHRCAVTRGVSRDQMTLSGLPVDRGDDDLERGEGALCRRCSGARRQRNGDGTDPQRQPERHGERVATILEVSDTEGV